MVDDRTALMSARALSPGYEILWYTIDRVLGQGGFGITYLAHDRNLDRAVAIKEYLPTSFAYRREDYSVKPITGDHSENYAWGLSSFQKEAQTLARFGHPNIVRVNSVFEANNTAYMVMEYEQGQSLAALYKDSGKVKDQSFFEQIFLPIFDGLKEIHKFEFIHRDIKPANIYIRDNGTPVLIDFGSARQTGQQQTNEMTALVSLGYTPLEQYSISYGEQGPWTDIYALAATIYEGIVGTKPDESLSRSARMMRAKPDLVEPLHAQQYPAFSQRFLDAVLAGLKLEPEGRPRSIELWSQQFNSANSAGDSSFTDSGFTALEEGRTRIQPRRQPYQDNSTAQAPIENRRPNKDSELHQSDMDARHLRDNSIERTSRGPDYASREDSFSGYDNQPAQNDHQPVDELLNFDDEKPLRVNPNAFRESSSESTRIHRKSSKWQGLKLATVITLTVMSAGAGYMFYVSRTSSSEMSVATLNKMPKPAQPISTTLPKDNALEQLSGMAIMAPLLAQAYAIEPADPELLDNIRQTETSLLLLAKTWNATRHADVASQIEAVSNAMPAAMYDHNRIQGILTASDQVSVYNEIIAFLDDKHYLRPPGNSVLDRISSVSTNEYQQIKSSAQWQQMMSELSQSAMDKLAQSKFEDAAKLTEAALSLDANHTGFNALRVFLAGH